MVFVFFGLVRRGCRLEFYVYCLRFVFVGFVVGISVSFIF